jgi:uncharacterized protein (DUF2336 family)
MLVATTKLSVQDVTNLLENPSVEARTEVLKKVSGTYNERTLEGHEKELAEEIFRALVHDAEVMVRQALAETLKDNPDAPKDIILDLVNDVDQVAVPVLQYSEVLDEDDLVSIIKGSDSTKKLFAISSREEVPEKVSEALIETGEEGIIFNLMERVDAKISESGFKKIFNKFAGDDSAMEKMVRREELPVELTEKVIGSVTEAIRMKFVEKYGDKNPAIKLAFERSKEAATLQFMGVTSEGDIQNLVSEMEQSGELAADLHNRNDKMAGIVEALEERGKLSPISALCMGHLQLFEVSLARISKVPTANVHRLVDDRSGEGFRALYHQTELPEEMLEAVWLVVRVLKGMEKEGEERKRQNAKDMITAILTRSEKEQKEVENLSYFISMIHQHAKIGTNE